MHLDAEFPDQEHARIAHALILLHAVERIRMENFFVQRLRCDSERLRPVLGITSNNPAEFLIEMTFKAILLDPENRRSYELLANLPRYSRQTKNRVEKGFIQMLDYFPDDPFPCLELSTIYYEKNTFRKAENILKEAMKRAPHDNRVIDRHVISLLISADNSIKRKKLHLASRDIEKSRTHYKAAAAAFACNDFNRMFFHAKRSFSLMQIPDNCHMLACSALLIRRFDIALELAAI